VNGRGQRWFRPRTRWTERARRWRSSRLSAWILLGVSYAI
jgi:hypothetical protein